MSFQENLQNWQKRNQAIGVKVSDKASPQVAKYVADDSFKKHLAEKGYTHYLALQVKTLLPYKDLHEKLTQVQAEVIDVLGAGVLGKTGDVGELAVRLIGITQAVPHAVEMSLRSIKPLDIIERPNIDFGMILPSPDGANITVFAKVLDDLTEHLLAHFNKSAGVKAERISYGGGMSQPGLFKIQLAVRVGSTPEDVAKAKYGKKGRIGKFDFWKLHVVDVADHKEYAEINIGEPDFSS